MTVDFNRGKFAPNTTRIYTLLWADFEKWCAAEVQPALPTTPAALGAYLMARAGTRKTATLELTISAVRAAHKIMKASFPKDSAESKEYMLDLERPEFEDPWASIKRAYGTRNEPKKPLLMEDLEEIVKASPTTFYGRRACAMLLTCYGAALRRSELVALDVEDLTFSPEGVSILIRRSKTDQGGQGKVLRIPRNPNGLCAVAHLEAWLAMNHLTSGPVFITDPKNQRRMDGKSYALVVKAAMKRIGRDCTDYSGHSTRRGYVTDAFEKGAPPESIKDTTRHVGLDMLLKYREAAQVFDSAANRAVWGLDEKAGTKAA